MESGLETDGLITEISRDRCVVSININGTFHTLSFGKSFLYTFGQQCDGDMTNILEEEMEVNVCYKYSQTLEKLSVIAVWIGEKPDLSNRDVELLDEFYNQIGIVDSLHDDGSFVARADGMDVSVVVRLDIMYRDGCLLETDQCPVAIGDTVTFDAIPSGGEPPGATYHATCAWIGTEPRLANRFKLSVSNLSSRDVETLTKDCVYGDVVVIPSNAVAFVRVEDCGVKVLLFRSSFNASSERMDDVVKVGDSVCMRLAFGFIFPGCRQWYAVAACMDGEDINEVNHESVTLMRESVSSGDVSSPAMSEDESESAGESDDSIESMGGLPSEIANAVAGNSSAMPPEVGVSATYKESSNLLFSEPPLTGMLCAKTKKSGIIRYGKLNILIKRKNFFCEGRPCTKKQFESMSKQITLVKFEAYPLRQLSMYTHVTLEASCAWVGGKPTLSRVVLNLIKGNYFPSKDKIFEGKVIGFYLPEVAFLGTGKTNKLLVFCLHLTDFGKESQPEDFCTKSCNKCIWDFVKIGEFVKFKVRQNSKFPLGMCAYGIEKSNKEVCKTLVRTQKPSSLRKMMKESKTDRVEGGATIPSHATPKGMVKEDEDRDHGSWNSVWGAGEYFNTGEIKVTVKGTYVVKFVPSKDPNIKVRLDLSTAIKAKQVYCDGKPLLGVSLTSKVSRRGKSKPNTGENSLEGREISFHVRRKGSAVNVNGVGVIKCAWIGEYPELPTLLAKKTAAFGGLICKKWCYEGVIEEFPLPTHAICKVGTLDVHLPLTPIIENGKMVGVVESHLKMGDRVLLRITTERYPTTKITCLTSSPCTSVKKLYDDQDVFRVVLGTVTELPNPLGKIKMLDGSIEVKFDRSSVLAINGVSRFSKIIYAWVHLLSKSMDVGAVVYFSAAKDLTLNSYRAYEVWIGKPPKKC